MSRSPARGRRAIVLIAALAGTLALAASASAHAIMSPAVVQAKALQQFTLSVPTEKEGATTTKIVLTVPDGFAVDSYEAEPGWKRSVSATGTGEDAVVDTITWSGGKVPTEEDSVFRINADATSAKTFTFHVKQYYSDGTVVDWNQAESGDDPAPTIKAVANLGSASTPIVTWIALLLGALGVLIGIGGFVAGKRPLA
jgi:uncharacterized protein YcnI